MEPLSRVHVLAKAMRLHNGLACALILWVGRSRVEGSTVEINAIAGVAVVLLSSAAHLVNDLLDFGADRANRPDRALPAGLLSAADLRRAALSTWLAGMILGVVVIPEWTAWWLVWGLAGPGYSLIAKGRSWLAPIWTAIVIASCWAAGALEGGLRLLDVPVFAGMVLYLVFRERVKALEDSPGDVLAGHRAMTCTFSGTPLGVLCLGATLVPFGVWLAYSGSGLLVHLAALLFLACLVGGGWSLLNPRPRVPHLAGSLLKVGAFAGVTLLWIVVP
ncbi:MAG: UbiA family prenyltransferase [Gemmatimonadales bacterium]|nr:UbiA family prenyltransferase [Gemmatimonadales bacterium]